MPKRPISEPPVFFKRKIGKYRGGVLYLRKGHEVLEAKSADLPFLYGDRREANGGGDSHRVVRALPPSPSTIREFVGRTYSLASLWSWLTDSDEPRIFLWGKGGSGKSTIAYEFASLIADNASVILDKDGRAIDAVIYLSAKRQYLVTELGKVADFLERDFTTSRELFEQILLTAEWVADVQGMSDLQIQEELRDLFDYFRVVLVIDDIDTLTTANLDPGMDALYRLLIRAKQQSKVLYTIRNQPSQSRTNSIEVPGLDIDTEYPEFIATCCNQWKLPLPPQELAFGPIAIQSERRPLVVEMIINLRRTCGTYDAALALFSAKGGDDTRSYLFDREYNALGSDNKARYLLAAISLFPGTARFSDLLEILRWDSIQIKDAISEVNEMFLNTSNDEKTGETLYSLGQATRSYIEGQRGRLDRFSHIKATVDAYRIAVQPKNYDLDLLTVKIRRYHNIANFDEALSLLDTYQDPALTQRAESQVLVGLSASKCVPPKYDRAREAFKYAVGMNHFNLEAMRAWFYVERTSGRGLHDAVEVCDRVLAVRQNAGMVRSEFLAKKAFALRTIAQNEFFTDRERSLNYFKQATLLQLEGITNQFKAEGRILEKPVSWCIECFEQLVEYAKRAHAENLVFNFLFEAAGMLLDPLVPSLDTFIIWFGRTRSEGIYKSSKLTMRRALEVLHSSKSPIFADESSKERITRALEVALATLERTHT